MTSLEKYVAIGPSGHDEGEQGVERDRGEAAVPFVFAHREPSQYCHLSELHNKVRRLLLLLILFSYDDFSTEKL